MLKPKRKYERRKPYKKPKDVGRPSHEATAERIAMVRLSRSLGATEQQIADHLGIAKNTLRDKYAEALAWRDVPLKAIVMRTFINQATGGALERNYSSENWEKANPSSTTTFVKSHGLVEKTGVEHSGSVGGLDLSGLTIEELETIRPIIARLAYREGGAEHDGGDRGSGRAGLTIEGVARRA